MENRAASGRDAAASKETKVEKKVTHPNIFAAFAAFQAENPEIKRTKKVKIDSRKGEDSSYGFWYAPLDEIFRVVRPLLAKHGLSVTHLEDGVGKSDNNRYLKAALFHETYVREKVGEKSTTNRDSSDGSSQTTTEPIFEERNVLYSMPILVARSGSMKDVGGESTYARRYTVGELLGIASDDDNDVALLEQRAGAMESSFMKSAEKAIKDAKTSEALDKLIAFYDADLKLIEEEKTPKLGFKKEQYDDLRAKALARKQEMGKNSVGKGAPGENKDGGGQGTLE